MRNGAYTARDREKRTFKTSTDKPSIWGGFEVPGFRMETGESKRKGGIKIRKKLISGTLVPPVNGHRRTTTIAPYDSKKNGGGYYGC